jgi:hypothetical protein
MGSLLKKNPVKTEKSQTKWINLLGRYISDQDWSDIYLNAYKLTSNTQLQSFQFKLNHGIVNEYDFYSH